MDTQRLDDTFAALADPTRRAIVNRLAEGPISVTELAKPFAMSLPAIHKHLGVLEDAGLIASKKVGRVRTCSIKADSMQAAAKWLAHYSRFWESKLDDFERFLDGQKTEKNKSKTKSSRNKKGTTQ